MALEKTSGNDGSFEQACRTLNSAKEEALGDDVESFQKSPALLERIAEADDLTYYHTEARGSIIYRLLWPPDLPKKCSSISVHLLH
jgi:hypothetical protein